MVKNDVHDETVKDDSWKICGRGKPGPEPPVPRGMPTQNHNHGVSPRTREEDCNTITKSHYETVMQQHAEIIDFVISRARDIAMIQHGRPPKGECRDTCFDEESGKLLVQFEEHRCGESTYDSYYVPIWTLFDKNWAEKYETTWKESKKRQEDDIRALKETRKETREKYEKQVYEQLRKKYEKQTD